MKKLLITAMLTIVAAQAFASEAPPAKQKTVTCKQTQSFSENGVSKTVENKIELHKSLFQNDDGLLLAVNYDALLKVDGKFNVLIAISDIPGQEAYGKLSAYLSENSFVASACVNGICELAVSSAYNQMSVIKCELK